MHMPDANDQFTLPDIAIPGDNAFQLMSAADGLLSSTQLLASFDDFYPAQAMASPITMTGQDQPQPSAMTPSSIVTAKPVDPKLHSLNMIQHHYQLAMATMTLPSSSPGTSANTTPTPSSGLVHRTETDDTVMEEVPIAASPPFTLPTHLQHPTPHESKTREELLHMVVALEKEKQQMMQRLEELRAGASQPWQSLPSEEPSTHDEDEEDDEDVETGSVTSEANDKVEMHCMWRGCGQYHTGIRNLTDHIIEAHIGSGKPTYRCEWLNCRRNKKPFTKRHKICNHLRSHTGERPFVCAQPGCDKRFSRPDSLTTHIKTHSTVRPFVCSYEGCEKAYYHARSLKKHLRLHEITQTSSPMTTTPPAAAVPPPPSQNYAFASYMMQPPPTSDQTALPPQVQHSLAPNQPQQKINTMFDPSLAFQQTLTPTPLPMVSLDVSNPPANVTTTTIDPMTPFQIGAIPYPMPLSAGPQQPIMPPNGYAL